MTSALFIALLVYGSYATAGTGNVACILDGDPSDLGYGGQGWKACSSHQWAFQNTNPNTQFFTWVLQDSNYTYQSCVAAIQSLHSNNNVKLFILVGNDPFPGGCIHDMATQYTDSYFVDVGTGVFGTVPLPGPSNTAVLDDYPGQLVVKYAAGALAALYLGSNFHNNVCLIMPWNFYTGLNAIYLGMAQILNSYTFTFRVGWTAAFNYNDNATEINMSNVLINNGCDVFIVHTDTMRIPAYLKSRGKIVIGIDMDAADVIDFDGNMSVLSTGVFNTVAAQRKIITQYLTTNTVTHAYYNIYYGASYLETGSWPNDPLGTGGIYMSALSPKFPLLSGIAFELINDGLSRTGTQSVFCSPFIPALFPAAYITNGCVNITTLGNPALLSPNIIQYGP